MASAGWQRLGRRIATERTRKGYPTVRAFAAAAGVSVRTVETIESGRHTGRPSAATLAKLEQALAWQSGSAERIVEGGRPRELIDPVMARITDVWPQLSGDQQIEVARYAEHLAGS